MDGEFNYYIKQDKELENEQVTVDDHNDWVTDLFNHLALLVTPGEREVKVRTDLQQYLHRRLQYEEQNLWKVTAAISSATDQSDLDRYLLEQYCKQAMGSN